jgi:MFS family permease
MVPVSGWVADRFGRRSSQLVITSVILLFGLSFGLLMDPAGVGTGEDVSTARVLFFLTVGMTLMGLTFGSMSAILPELFPTNVRYTGSGVAYNTASILGAAITPYVAVTLNATYGVGSVGLYLAFGAVLTLVALWFSPETKDVDMENVVTRR